MINPQDLDLSAMPWLPLDEKGAFPKASAIYFAIAPSGVVPVALLLHGLPNKAEFIRQAVLEKLEKDSAVQMEAIAKNAR